MNINEPVIYMHINECAYIERKTTTYVVSEYGASSFRKEFQTETEAISYVENNNGILIEDFYSK